MSIEWDSNPRLYGFADRCLWPLDHQCIITSMSMNFLKQKTRNFLGFRVLDLLISIFLFSLSKTRTRINIYISANKWTEYSSPIATWCRWCGNRYGSNFFHRYCFFKIICVICIFKYGAKVQKVTNYTRFFKNKMKIFFKVLIIKKLFL